MRPSVSSQHSRPPNYLLPGAPPDDLLLNEWVLVLRGDGKSARTIEGYTDSMRQLIAFLRHGRFPGLTTATAEHLREWLNSLRERGNKPPRVPESVQPFYTGEDLQAVLKSLRSRRLRGVDAARTRVIVLALFDTGLRASELCDLRTEDVNWEAPTIIVRLTKGGDQRVVSLGTAAARALAAYLRLRGSPQPWLFTTLDGRRMTKNALKLLLRRTFDSADVEFKGIHAFRRGSGIEYLRQGGQAEDLRVLMGWKSAEMIRRYVKAAEVERATAAHKRHSPSDALEL